MIIQTHHNYFHKRIYIVNMSYIPTLATIEEGKEEQPQVIFLPNNTKKNRRRYRRHIRKERKSYFKEATENKTWESDQFLDDIYDWYFA